MENILKDNNVVEVKDVEVFELSPLFGEVGDSISEVDEEEYDKLGFIYANNKAQYLCTVDADAKLRRLGSKVAELMNNFINLVKRTSVVIDAEHIMLLLNRDFKKYCAREAFVAMGEINQFIEKNKNLDIISIKNICNKLEFSSACLDGFISSVERVGGDYNLHREVLDKFLFANASLLTTQVWEMHVHSKAHTIFYNRLSSDSMAGKRVFVCSKKAEQEVIEKILVLKTDDAVEELGQKLFQGLRNSEAKVLKDKVIQLQNQKRRESGGGRRRRDIEEEEIFIESEEEFINLLLKFLASVDIGVRSKEDPLYCSLSCPSMLFNLGKGVTEKSKKEIEKSLRNSFKFNELRVAPLRSTSLGKLILVVGRSLLVGTIVPDSIIPMIRKEMPTNKKGADIKEWIIEQFKDKVSNQKALDAIGHRVKECEMHMDRGEAPETVEGWRELLEIEIENGNIAAVAKAADSLLAQIKIQRESAKAAGEEVDSKVAEIKIFDTFFLLPTKRKAKIVDCLMSRKVPFDAKSLLHRSVETRDKKFIKCLLSRFGEKELQGGQAMGLTGGQIEFVKKFLIKNYKAYEGSCAFLASTGILIDIVVEFGYKGFKDFESKLGKKINSLVYGYTEHESNLTISRCIADLDIEHFEESWINLPQNIKELQAGTLDCSDQTLAMVLARSSDTIFQRFWRDPSLKDVNELALILPKGETDDTLISIILQNKSGFFRELWTGLEPVTQRAVIALELRQNEDSRSLSTELTLEYDTDFFVEFWEGLEERDRLAYVGNKTDCIKLISLILKYKPEYFQTFWRKLSKITKINLFRSFTHEDIPFLTKINTAYPNLFKEYWSGLSDARRDRIIESDKDYGLMMAFIIAKFIPEYLPGFYSKLSSETRNLYNHHQISFLPKAIADKSYNYFCGRYWKNLSLESRSKIIFQEGEGDSLAVVLAKTAGHLDHFWSKMITARERAHFCRALPDGSNPLASVIAMHDPKYLKRFWNIASVRAKRVLLKDSSFEGRTLAMNIAKFAPSYFRDFMEEDTTIITRKEFITKVDSNGESLAMYVAKYLPNYFNQFWNKASPVEKKVFYENSPKTNRSLLTVVAESCPECLKEVWNHGETLLVRRANQRNLLINLDTAISVLTSVAQTCPRDLYAIWASVPALLKKDHALYNKEGFKDKSLLNLMNSGKMQAKARNSINTSFKALSKLTDSHMSLRSL